MCSGLLENTCFFCHKHSWRWPDVMWKISHFGCRKHTWKLPKVSLKISSGVTLLNAENQTWTAVTRLAVFVAWSFALTLSDSQRCRITAAEPNILSSFKHTVLVIVGTSQPPKVKDLWWSLEPLRSQEEKRSLVNSHLSTSTPVFISKACHRRCLEFCLLYTFFTYALILSKTCWVILA